MSKWRTCMRGGCPVKGQNIKQSSHNKHKNTQSHNAKLYRTVLAQSISILDISTPYSHQTNVPLGSEEANHYLISYIEGIHIVTSTFRKTAQYT
jgi:hypothetical protein